MTLVLAGLLIPLLFAESSIPATSPGRAAGSDKITSDSKQTMVSDGRGAATSISAAIDKLTSEVAGWNRQAAKARESESPGGWAMWSTILTALATAFIALVGYLQWRAIRKQAEYMEDALVETKKAADAAAKSANAALGALESVQRQTRIAEEAARNAKVQTSHMEATLGAIREQSKAMMAWERCFIVADVETDLPRSYDASIELDEGSAPYWIRPVVSNTGRSFARLTYLQVSVIQLPADGPASTLAIRRMGEYPLPPNLGARPFQIQLTRQQFHAAMTGQTALDVLIAYSYEDAFGKTEPDAWRFRLHVPDADDPTDAEFRMAPRMHFGASVPEAERPDQ